MPRKTEKHFSHLRVAHSDPELRHAMLRVQIVSEVERREEREEVLQAGHRLHGEERPTSIQVRSGQAEERHIAAGGFLGARV